MRVKKQEVETLSPMDYTRSSCKQNKIRAIQRTSKKEIIVEIQEVEINSPTPTPRSRTPEDDQHVTECMDYETDLVTNELEELQKLNEPVHTPKENDADESTLDQETEIPEEGNEASITNRECIKSGNSMDKETFELESLQPEGLEEESLEPVPVESESLDSEVLEEKPTEIGVLDPENLEQQEHFALEMLEEKDVNLEPLEMKFHLKPHDYTSKQPCSVAGSPPKTRPKPRRRTTNISGKALYKSLLMACDTCGKMIERNRLEGHRNKHMGIRPYSCPNEACNAAFHCKHARRLHVRCRHGNESFSCDICGRVYRARRDLLGHKREAHSEPKFECDICFKKFTTR
ncbi:AGAP004580-PA-like protein [Anopheles sinensis]|uniref:AGAP004580-PA-like protein n=1 Tax=Anopheles sinensis TaxID=74873 RepID=A0A084W5H8_ANOSI|nr:AGAP004580-PA-like protein [Anopheles sinensis]